jgi:hypothetical protein
MLRDHLWTSAALPVDGLVVRLRRFRKSHHLIPASLDPDKCRAVGELRSAAMRHTKRVGLLRAYQPSYLDLSKGKVETACPSSKA